MSEDTRIDATLEVTSFTVETWPAFDALVQRHNGIFGGCWCCRTSIIASQYDAEKDVDPDHRITCVFVDRRFRRHGVTEVAIRGALDLIARAGGGVVEAYPHDLTHQTKKMSSSFLYNCTRRLYARLGFSYVRPKGLKNCVMSTEVPARS